MKKTILTLMIFVQAYSLHAQGPEPRESGFNIEALLTGFAQAVEGYKLRSSIKISELDQVNSNFSGSYLDLVINMKSSVKTNIFKFEDPSLAWMDQNLELGEPDLLKVIQLKVTAQIPHQNVKKFILDNELISPRFFEFYNYSDYIQNPNDSTMTPQFITGNLKFSKPTQQQQEQNSTVATQLYNQHLSKAQQYQDHHLKVIVRSKINEDLYHLNNCHLIGVLLPEPMHLFYKLNCDYKLITNKYQSLIGNGMQEGATIKGFIDLEGELDPAFYDSNFSL